MDLVTFPFRLPFLPLQGLVRLAELIQEEAESQYHDPAAVRRALEEAEEAYAHGEISSEDLYEAEVEAVGRVVDPPGNAPGGGPGPAALPEPRAEEE